MNEEKFFRQWFGLIGGRELGWNTFPHRNWTDNPDDLLRFVEACKSSHEVGEFCRPCWITAQPQRFLLQKGKRKIGQAMAIEKLFFDFDDDTKYCKQCDKYIKKNDLIKNKLIEGGNVVYIMGSFCPRCKSLCEEKPRLELVGENVKKFIQKSISICKSQSKRFNPEPFVVKTRKGYHVYFFLVEILTFRKTQFKFAKILYEELQEILIGGIEYEFMDEAINGDLMRFARVPLTMHEKNGKICDIVDINLKKTKVRNIDFYKIYGIPNSFVESTIEKLKRRLHKEHIEREKKLKEFGKEAVPTNGNYRKEIRPCFRSRMEKGEMSHPQRLAWLAEIFHNGYNTIEKMMELCRKTWNDFDETKSLNNIKDYFSHERYTYPPYRCSTIQEKGWCLHEKCPLWNAKHAK